MMPAEEDGLPQRIQENFAVRACTEVRADLGANISGQFIVKIGRQLLQDLETITLAMIVMNRPAGAGVSGNLR
jgi:hypothetical protein